MKRFLTLSVFALLALGGCSKDGDDTPPVESQYTITVTGVQGGMAEVTLGANRSVKVGQGAKEVMPYEIGAELRLTAHPDEGYVCQYWILSVRDVGTILVPDAPLPLAPLPSPAGDMEIRAVFEPYPQLLE